MEDYDFQDSNINYMGVMGRRRNPNGNRGARNDNHSLLNPMNGSSDNDALLQAEEEVFSCLDGDEKNAQLWNDMMKDPHKDCGVGCGSHGNFLEMEEIESIHSKLYGKKSDESIYKDIADDYRRRIYTPQNDQKKILEKIHKRKLDDIPEWSEEDVRKHIEYDTINITHEIGRDIRKARMLLSHLEYNQVARVSKDGKKFIVQGSLDNWIKLSKHKTELCMKLESLDKKKNGENMDKKTSKPSGSRS